MTGTTLGSSAWGVGVKQELNTGFEDLLLNSLVTPARTDMKPRKMAVGSRARRRPSAVPLLKTKSGTKDAFLVSRPKDLSIKRTEGDAEEASRRIDKVLSIIYE